MRERSRNVILSIFTILGFSLSPLMADAKDIGFQCRTVYANPTNSKQTVYSGVLVELADGKQSLIYAPNRWGPGHETALRNIFMKSEDAHNPIVKVLWMGELALRENSDHKQALIAVNDISGTYFKSTTRDLGYGIPIQNDLKAIEDFVSKNDSWDVSKTQYVPYEKNKSHLDLPSEYLKQEMQISNSAHDIGNVFHAAIGFGDLIILDPSKSAKYTPVVKSVLPQYIVALEVMAMESIFKEIPIARLIEISKSMMTADNITLEQWKEFLYISKRLNEKWSEYSQRLGQQMHII